MSTKPEIKAVEPPVPTQFLTAYGKRHTLKNSPDKQYSTISFDEIVQLVKAPAAAQEKDDSQFFIPSGYIAYDGRTHSIQRERGMFGMLVADIDKGSPELNQLVNAIKAVLGNCQMVVYSTNSATAELRKWRALIPVMLPIKGELYPAAQDILFERLAAQGIICDSSLDRTAQPVYLPNIAPTKRDSEGKPLFYEKALLLSSPKFDPSELLAEAQERVKLAEQARIEAAKLSEAKRKERQQKQLLSGKESVIDSFNAAHSIDSLLVKYGFVNRYGTEDWCSPLQSSDGYPCRDFGDYWVILSESAKQHGLGAVSASGVSYGDAWDLYVFFEHNLDHKRAWAEWSKQMARAGADALFDIIEIEDAVEKPVVIDPLLSNLPYQLGNMQTYICGTQIYPDAEFAALAAIQLSAHFAQRNFLVDNGMGLLGLHQYTISLAGTSAGKERLNAAMEKLKDAVLGGSFNLEQHVGDVVGSLPASLQAMHLKITASRDITFINDEFGEWLASAASGKNPHRQETLGYLMSLYTKPTAKVEPPQSINGKYEPVSRPRVGVMGLSTAERMADVMTGAHGDSGAFNRFIFYIANAGLYSPENKRHRGFEFEPNEDLVEWLKWLSRNSKDDKMVTFTEDAINRMIAVDIEQLEPIKHSDPMFGGRLLEQAVKLAGLIALADRRMEVRVDDFELAVKLRLSMYHKARDWIDSIGGVSTSKPTTKALNQISEALARKGRMPTSRFSDVSRAFRELEVHQQRSVLKEIVDRGIAIRRANGRGEVYVTQEYLDTHPLAGETLKS